MVTGLIWEIRTRRKKTVSSVPDPVAQTKFGSANSVKSDPDLGFSIPDSDPTGFVSLFWSENVFTVTLDKYASNALHELYYPFRDELQTYYAQNKRYFRYLVPYLP